MNYTTLFTALAAFFLLLTFRSHSQDVIYMRSGEKIDAVVTEVSKMEIKYKEFQFQDGPVRAINPASVYMIRYSNGKEEFFRPDPHDPVEKKWVAKKSYYENGNNTYFASFALGHGPSYGWIGIRYQGRYGKELGFGWHAGAGVFPAMRNIDNTHFFYSGGLKFFYFRGLYVDVQYGSFAAVSETDYNGWDYTTRDIVLYGPSFTTGLDWFFNRYIGINAAIGCSYDVNEVKQHGRHVFPAIEWGVVVKW